MPLFSRRNNILPEPAPDKPGQISNRLRTLLWNDFDTACRDFYRVDRYTGLSVEPPFSIFLQYVWSEDWAQPADEYPGLEKMMTHLKKGFLEGVWYFAFDILESAFFAQSHGGFDLTSLRESVSRRLDQESSAYMLFGDNFVERMNESEVESVASALVSDDDAVRIHFGEALKKLSERQNPDYRNSIKESISAVESA